ncbi:MAG: apolipoprotein N-acyltransferase, partial [Armatimonadetes bacterium]|nr:apolipoprotein N-acyltransferase [Armatimonadota bacterium]
SLLLRAAALAAAWVLVEYIRSHIGALAVNFGDIAYSQYEMLSLLQIASVLGSGAVTLVIVFTNALIASVFVQHRLERLEARQPAHPQMAKPVLIGLTVVFVVILGGAVVIQSGSFLTPSIKEIAPGKPLQAILIQGNVAIQHPATQEDAERCRLTYVDMTSKAAGGMLADLIVWPETSLPVALNESPEYLDEVKKVAKETGAYLLMGALEAAGGQVHNSAYLFSGEGELLDTYRKVDLVMFGEYVPNLGPLNRLVKRYPIRSQNVVPGAERNLLQVYEVPLGTLICWEAIFAGPNRELCRKGAQLLVAITSDSWAAYSPELRQHGAIASVRAVESRRYMVRAATMGPSAIINPYGRRIAQVPPGEEGVTVGKVYPLSGLSIYHRIGDLPLLIICAVVWMAAMFARRQP